MTPATTREFSPDSRSRRWGGSSNIPLSRMVPTGSEAEPEGSSYRAYLKRVRESRPYWLLLDYLLIYRFDGAHRPPSPQPSIPISILEIAADGSKKDFNYKTHEELRKHLETPHIRDGYGYTGISNRGRRIILVTSLPMTVLEVIGDVYGMDFGFFVDHFLPDEHMSYTAKTTRGNHCHILDEKNPESKRLQFEYREIGRVTDSFQSSRSVCRVFERPKGLLTWDSIYQKRFSVFSHTPSDGGLITDIYLFDEHAYRGPFALGISRLGLPSFSDFKNCDRKIFDRSIGIYAGNERHAREDARRLTGSFQDEVVKFFKSPDFDAKLAFESSSYIINHVLRLTLVMWRHMLVRVEHSFLVEIENQRTSEGFQDGSLSSVIAELSKCAHLVQKKTIPTIKALCKDDSGENNLGEVLEEYTTLCEDIQHIATRAEKALTIVLSKLSITESKKAIEHSVRGIELAKRVGRLTKLAFVFIPLSFVTSFLGMMQFDGNFSDQTNRVIWIFFAMSMPLVLIIVFLAVPDRILSVVTRFVYLSRRRFGIGWMLDQTSANYYVVRGDPWEKYYNWLCAVGWERKEDVHPKRLIITRDDDNKGIERVGLILGTLLHLNHAWHNVR